MSQGLASTRLASTRKVSDSELYLTGRLPGETAHVDDQFFVSGAVPGTSVAPTGTNTWTRERDVLTLKAAGNSEFDVIARVFPITSAASPMSLRVGFHAIGYDLTHALAVCVGFADGNTAAANVVGVKYYRDPSNATVYTFGGTFTVTTVTLSETVLNPYDFGPMELGHVWKSANTWATTQAPPAGNARTDYSLADHARTLTPTHFFIGGYNTQAAGKDMIIDFKYIRVDDSDLSV